MRHRVILPDSLGEQFSLAQAADAGIGVRRCAAADLHRPFRGIRSQHVPETFRAVVDCYLPRMKPGQRYGGRTGARLWGLPLRMEWTMSEPLDIVVPARGTAPRTAGVRGRRLRDDRAVTWLVSGAPVVDAVAAVFLCAAELTVGEVVVLVDALITDADNYPGLVPRVPSTPDEIDLRLQAWGRFPGCGTVRRALALARPHVESPKETQTRLLLTEAGLPEPEVQHSVYEHGRFVARVDLAYPAAKIAIEYEGDGHRRSKEQWRKDIRRQRELEAQGWLVIRITELDLKDGAATLLARIRAAIADRSAGAVAR